VRHLDSWSGLHRAHYAAAVSLQQARLRSDLWICAAHCGCGSCFCSNQQRVSAHCHVSHCTADGSCSNPCQSEVMRIVVVRSPAAAAAAVAAARARWWSPDSINTSLLISEDGASWTLLRNDLVPTALPAQELWYAQQPLRVRADSQIGHKVWPRSVLGPGVCSERPPTQCTIAMSSTMSLGHLLSVIVPPA
jgi:hypothetical protein